MKQAWCFSCVSPPRGSDTEHDEVHDYLKEARAQEVGNADTKWGSTQTFQQVSELQLSSL